MARELHPPPASCGLAAAAGGAETGFLARFSFWQVFAALATVIVATIVVIVGEKLNRNVEGTVEGSYGRMELWARWLGLRFQHNQTPNERANLLTATVPEGEAPIQTLTDEYIRKQFSPDKKDNFLVNTLHEWKVLRPILFKKGLNRRFKREK